MSSGCHRKTPNEICPSQRMTGVTAYLPPARRRVAEDAGQHQQRGDHGVQEVLEDDLSGRRADEVVGPAERRRRQPVQRDPRCRGRRPGVFARNRRACGTGYGRSRSQASAIPATNQSMNAGSQRSSRP
jgi:hypothetical protein